MKKYHIKLNGKIYEIEVKAVEEKETAGMAKAVSGSEAATKGDDTSVLAPLPGKVLSIAVKPGSSVKAGDVMMILEAMKLENEIVAPSGGTVQSIHVDKGADVATGDCLIVLA